MNKIVEMETKIVLELSGESVAIAHCQVLLGLKSQWQSDDRKQSIELLLSPGEIKQVTDQLLNRREEMLALIEKYPKPDEEPVDKPKEQGKS